MKVPALLVVFLWLSLCPLNNALAENGFSDQFQPGNSSSDIALNFNLEIMPMSAGITDNPGIGDILRQVNEDVPLTTRGPQEAALYRKVAPSVVLIVNNDKIGSGSLLSGNLIITNEHVVSGRQKVAVIFKPRQAEREPQASDAVQGEVLLVDKARDLALVKVNDVPEHVVPLRLANLRSISVGSDVHAIGHPRGISWTYTKGVVSQIHAMPLIRGSAPVKIIQTQTPINPGNSGGPLLNDKGEIVGVNTFKVDGEALNFAVAVDEVKRFVDGKSSTAGKPSVTPADGEDSDDSGVYVGYEGRSKANDSNIVIYYTKSTDQIKAVMCLPDNKNMPLMLIIDRNLDNQDDVTVYSFKRDAEFWDESYWDDDFNGRYELKGLHRNGSATPYKYVSHRGALPY